MGLQAFKGLEIRYFLIEALSLQHQNLSKIIINHRI